MTTNSWSPEKPIFRVASQWLIGVFLTLSLTGLFLAISAVQLTSPGTGQRIVRRAVAVLTDIDAVLPGIHANLQEDAAQAEGDTVRVPGFPIPIELSKQEAVTIREDDLRARLLDESADLAYEEGLDVFADPESKQDIDLISTAGAIDRGLSLVTEDNHNRIRIAAVVLGFLSAILTALLLISVRSYMRLVALGASTLAAALPSLAAAVAIRFSFRTAQEEADPFVNGLLELGVDAIWLPLRNYIAFAALGSALLALGVALIWASARWPAAPAAAVDNGSA